MKRGGVAPKVQPVGWAFIKRKDTAGITVRWRRGDATAYVLEGKRIGEHGLSGVLGTVPVALKGWVDLVEVRLLGERWVRQG